MNSNRKRIIRLSALVVVGFFMYAVLFVSSCLDRLPPFSHKKHVVEQELQCNTCHTGSEDGARAGAPNPDICATCHEEVQANLDMARELASRWPRLKTLPPDGIFSHKTHQDADIKCEQCHGNVGTSDKVKQKHIPAEADCLFCHTKVGISTDCSTCHQTINTSTAPPDHNQTWIRSHGEVAGEPVRGERCYRCHAKSSCLSCHAVQKPYDHTATWREYGHGVASQFDRNRCFACHRSDSCMRCHQESSPRSHRAGFGPPSNRHCYDCHLTGGEVSCVVCHGSAITHLSAPRIPAGAVHASASDCRSCHNGFLLKHPDNGESCKLCHKL